MRSHGPCERISEPADAAVVFVDLAGFTALTEVHGDHEAAEVAEAFADLTRAVLGDGDRLVKTIGDGLLLTSSTAASALELVRRIADATAHADAFPLVRAGVNFGPIVRSRTDVYGSTVNIAARIAAMAQPGQILVTQSIADVAESSGLTTRSLGPMALRNVADPVAVFAVDLAVGCACGQVDPVCRMRLDERTTSRLHTFEGTDYRFCSPGCAQRFAAGPQNFARAADCLPVVGR